MAQTALRSEAYLPEYDEDDPEGKFYYGYRTVINYDENGDKFFTYRPLTLDDFLEPEEGDVLMQGELHEENVGKLKSIFRHHMKKRENVKVYSDLKIIWGIPNLKNPAPDISIVENVKNPEKYRESFSVKEEGTSPFFVLEVVSPLYRKADVKDKPDIYRKAGVSEYFIIDSEPDHDRINYKIEGYRLAGIFYRKISPDAQGRFESITTGVHLKIDESADRIIVTDAATGEELLPGDERAEAAEVRAEGERILRAYAEARADDAEALAEQEKARAEQEKAEKERERLRAEQEKARAEQEKARAEKEKAEKEREKARADSAEEEIRRLREKLAELGIRG